MGMSAWEAELSWDAQKVKLFLLACGVFIASWFMSCRELRYSLWGQTADARIMRIEKISSSDSDSPRRMVSFTFKEPDGTVRKNAAIFEPDQVPQGMTLKVQYLAGQEELVRPYGRREWGWMIAFFASVAVVGVFVGRLVWEARS